MSTARLLNDLEQKGFAVRDVKTSGDSLYGMHTVRLLNRYDSNFSLRTLNLNELFFELILTNSHDGSTHFSLELGVFRLICLNGLTAQTGSAGKVVIKHAGFKSLVFNDGLDEIISAIPQVTARIKEFGEIELSQTQSLDFGRSAAALIDSKSLSPAHYVTPRRPQDKEPTLWNVLNIAQEHLIKGGVRLNSGSKTRKIRSAAEEMRLNNGVWEIAEDFAAMV